MDLTVIPGSRIVEVARRQRSPRGILVEHVWKDPELHRLERKVMRTLELSSFELRQVELA